MKWNIKDWHANYYYNITAILQQQARIPISSVPILNFFQLICRIEIHRTLISCNLQKCALEQVQVADEQLGRSETKHFYRLQGRRVLCIPILQIGGKRFGDSPEYYEFVKNQFLYNIV